MQFLADPFQSFDEFLLMFSVFSEKAPREMKVHYAFKIYGKSPMPNQGPRKGPSSMNLAQPIPLHVP